MVMVDLEAQQRQNERMLVDERAWACKKSNDRRDV